MKKTNLKNILVLFTMITIGFSACTKDNPVPEANQEEYDATEIKFINTEDAEDVVIIKFDKKGHPSPHHVHLTAGETYHMAISLFYNGKSINEEILEAADEHQFFFLGSPEGVLDYTYGEASRIGLSGTVRVLKSTDKGFDWNVVLRHGLNKTNSAAQTWDNTNYPQAGGSDDLNITFEIHPTESGDHAIDHS